MIRDARRFVLLGTICVALYLLTSTFRSVSNVSSRPTLPDIPSFLSPSAYERFGGDVTAMLQKWDKLFGAYKPIDGTDIAAKRAVAMQHTLPPNVIENIESRVSSCVSNCVYSGSPLCRSILSANSQLLDARHSLSDFVHDDEYGIFLNEVEKWQLSAPCIVDPNDPHHLHVFNVNHGGFGSNVLFAARGLICSILKGQLFVDQPSKTLIYSNPHKSCSAQRFDCYFKQVSPNCYFEPDGTLVETINGVRTNRSFKYDSISNNLLGNQDCDFFSQPKLMFHSIVYILRPQPHIIARFENDMKTLGLSKDKPYISVQLRTGMRSSGDERIFPSVHQYAQICVYAAYRLHIDTIYVTSDFYGATLEFENITAQFGHKSIFMPEEWFGTSELKATGALIEDFILDSYKNPPYNPIDYMEVLISDVYIAAHASFVVYSDSAYGDIIRVLSGEFNKNRNCFQRWAPTKMGHEWEFGVVY